MHKNLDGRKILVIDDEKDAWGLFKPNEESHVYLENVGWAKKNMLTLQKTLFAE